MEYKEEQRQQINNKLNKCIEKVSEANHCEKLIKSTNEDYNLLNEQCKKLKEQLKKEEHDVDKLNQISFSNFLHTVLNNKDEKMDKEKQEAFEAKLKCDSAWSQLENCKDTLEHLDGKLNGLCNAEDEYNTVIREKKEYILRYMPTSWSEISKLIDDSKLITNHKKEIEEAISAGSNTMVYINKALKSLKSAENWGTFDMLGGGLIATMAKRDKMDQAQGHMINMQKNIGLFARELKDVDGTINCDLELDSFLGFADYFFDGFFVDWAVQSKINNAQHKVYKTFDEVELILQKLNGELENMNSRKNEVSNKIATLVETA